jgi:hypothetical protein
VKVALLAAVGALGFVLGVHATTKLYYAKPCRGCGARWTRHHEFTCEYAGDDGG